jgi:hypothetical protein
MLSFAPILNISKFKEAVSDMQMETNGMNTFLGGSVSVFIEYFWIFNFLIKRIICRVFEICGNMFPISPFPPF